MPTDGHEGPLDRRPSIGTAEILRAIHERFGCWGTLVGIVRVRTDDARGARHVDVEVFSIFGPQSSICYGWVETDADGLPRYPLVLRSASVSTPLLAVQQHGQKHESGGAQPGAFGV